MKSPIYLDNAATTPIDPLVVEKMLPFLADHFGNATATHTYAKQPAAAIKIARQAVATLLNTEAQNIIWTSGATEAINLAIKGVAFNRSHPGKHIVTCLTEHSATLETCRFLETQGFDVTYLTPAKNGLIPLATLAAALRADTILVSIMHANNEIGVIHDIQAIGELTTQRNILLHVDAAQSAGKIPIDLKTLAVDLMSLSAHKLYGPKGIGALYIKPQVRLVPLLHGGEQENNLRAGTLATHQIVGMGAAFAIATQKLASETEQIQKLRDHLWDGLNKLAHVTRNGDTQHCLPGILNVTFAHIDNEALLPALRDIALSTGSACHAQSTRPSHVLTAIGLSEALANRSVRFSLGRFTTHHEIEFALQKITHAVNLLS